MFIGFILSSTIAYAAVTYIAGSNEVSTDNGNGKLTYPVGLLTADEVVYAGAVHNAYNTSYYLYTSQYWWTMSPYKYDSTNGAIMYAVKGYNGGGIYDSQAFQSDGVRPVVSLKRGVSLSGSGTSASPYTVTF